MKRLILPALAALALSACASEPTHFQPVGPGHKVGYSELRIEPGRYRVTFQGGPGAPPNQVQDFALLRAANLAIADGYDWFRIVNRETHQTGYSGATMSLGVGGASYGHNSAAGVGVETGGIPLGGGAILAASMEVVMGKGPRPPDPDVYDALGVQRALSGQAPGPPPPASAL